MIQFLKKRPFIFFILPGFCLYTLISIYSILSSLPYSLTKWSGITPPEFNGIQNYLTVFTNPRISKEFYNALWNNVQLTFWGFVILVPISIYMGYLMFRKVPLHNGLKLISYSPYFVNFVTTGFMVTLFFDPHIGLLSNVLSMIGSSWSTAQFFETTSYGIPYILIVHGWKTFGYYMLLVFANFNMIPADYEEAATIDGASEWQIFRHIYLPLLKPSLVNVFILQYIWGVSAFEVPYMLGGETGGMAGNMDVLGIFLYRQAFNVNSITNSMGMGTTVATIIFVLVLLGAAVQLKVMNAGESDE